MPTINVTTFVRYISHRNLDSRDRTQVEWDGHHIRNVVKGDDLKGRFDWTTLDGRTLRVTKDGNVGLFQNDVSKRFALKIINDVGHRDLDIVPVPNSSACVGSDESFRTGRIAAAIASFMSGACESLEALRWREVQEKAHAGGRRRDVDLHLRNLRVVKKPRRPVVLFDDFITSGSQMCASKLKLEGAGFKVLGCYAIVDVVDLGERGSAPAFKVIERNPLAITDFFDEIDID